MGCAVTAVTIQVSPFFTGGSVRYAAPAVLAVSALTLDTAGGEKIVVTGSDMGPVGTKDLQLRYSNRWGDPAAAPVGDGPGDAGREHRRPDPGDPLDAATEATTAYFSQPRFDHWERRTFHEGDLGRVRNRLLPETAGRFIAFLDADLAFHKTILFAARNPALARTVEESHIQSRIFYADRGVHDTVRLARACKQHGNILEALEKHDGLAAAEAMRAHIRSSLEATLEHLEVSIED